MSATQALIFSDKFLFLNTNWSALTTQKEGDRFIQTLLGLGTHFQGKKMVICLSQAKPLRKSNHSVYVVYVCVLMSAH